MRYRDRNISNMPMGASEPNTNPTSTSGVTSIKVAVTRLWWKRFQFSVKTTPTVPVQMAKIESSPTGFRDGNQSVPKSIGTPIIHPRGRGERKHCRGLTGQSVGGSGRIGRSRRPRGSWCGVFWFVALIRSASSNFQLSFCNDDFHLAQRGPTYQWAFQRTDLWVFEQK